MHNLSVHEVNGRIPADKIKNGLSQTILYIHHKHIITIKLAIDKLENL